MSTVVLIEDDVLVIKVLITGLDDRETRLDNELAVEVKPETGFVGG